VTEAGAEALLFERVWAPIREVLRRRCLGHAMKTAAVSVRGVDIGLSGVLAEQGEDDLSAVRRPSWIEGSAIDAQSDPSETFSGGAHNKEPSTTGEQDLSAVRRPATGFLGQAPRRYAPHVVVAQPHDEQRLVRTFRTPGVDAEEDDLLVIGRIVARSVFAARVKSDPSEAAPCRPPDRVDAVPAGVTFAEASTGEPCRVSRPPDRR
jgi:hypothetical protein